jgi:hypothetical protein
VASDPPPKRPDAGCQFCKAESIPVSAVDAAHAWADLEKLGGRCTCRLSGALVTALCGPCSEKDERTMMAVKSAMRSRKRSSDLRRPLTPPRMERSSRSEERQ